jgi:DHA1 family multidrug resistance protein-like MFS transporter
VDAGRRNLFVVFISNFVAATGMAGFLPAFPLILEKLDVHDHARVALWTGLLTGAAPFAAAIAGPFWGAVGDRIGRKVMVLRALLGLTVFVGLMSFVRDPFVLLLLRLCQGVFSGFIGPSLTLVSVQTPPHRQGFVAAVLQSALVAGGVAGPPIGGFLLDRHSPSMLFTVASAAAGASAILVILFTTEESKPTQHTNITKIWIAFSRAADDIKDVLREPAVWRMLVALFAVRFGTSCVEPLFAIYVKTFEQTHNFVANNLAFVNGALVAATPLGNLIALPAWGHAGDKRGYRFAFILAAGGAGLFYLPQAFMPDPVSLFAVRFFSGVFLAGVIPSAYGLVASETPLKRRGSSFSLTFSSIALANSFAPAVGGAVAGSFGVRPLLVASAVPLFGAAVWLWASRRRPLTQQTDSQG